MQIYKTLVTFEDDGEDRGFVLTCDTIEHEGKFWLVGEWIESTDKKTRLPAIIVLLDNLPHQKSGDVKSNFAFVLNQPIPKCVLSGIQPEESKFHFVIVKNPDIKNCEKPTFH